MTAGIVGRLRTGAFVVVLALLPALAGASLAQAKDASQAAQSERRAAKKPQKAKVPEGYSRTRLHLKFAEGTSIRLRGDRFVSLGGQDVSGVNAVLAKYRGTKVDRLFERSEQELASEHARIERKTRRDLADKNLYYRLVLRPGTSTESVIGDLNELGIVELAYAEPLAAPPPVTPSFVAQQDYREAAGDGIDADFANAIPGGTGANVTVIDIEYSWNQAHEDLAVAAGALIPNGTPSDPFSSNDHGTAVIGEIVGDGNAFGVTGIAHDAGLGLVNASNTADGYDLADSIDTAHAALAAGDVIIIEQQTTGANGGCDSTTQVGCVAVEWVQAFYDAIAAATADGIIVLEAAGNGMQDLGDTGDYGSPFPDGRADSGAIIVGAGSAPGCTAPLHGRLNFSSFGPRVNLQGYGECVVTTGYGGLQGGPMNEWYTSSFSGTSSATPIVTGAAAIVSSIAQQQGVPMTPAQIRTLLMNTGTAQATGGSALAGNIGPLPNLRAALESAFLPAADAGGPYSTAEGTDVSVSASGSTDPQGSALTYAWDLDNDGQFDDGTGVSVSFTHVGRDGPKTIRVRATDPAGAFDDDSATVNVTNVAPTASVSSISAQPENTAVSLTGVVTDAGWEDPLSATVDWGDGNVEPVSGATEHVRPDATLSFGASHVYGDDGTFTVTVCPSDDDTTGTCVSTSASIGNVIPTATIDETGTTLVNGVPTFIASIGVPVPFSGRTTDPGSDDLTTAWDWDDGAPAPDVSTLWLVNPPLADPQPSPSIQPRDVTDDEPHAFADACFYTVGFSSTDDGGAAANDSVQVIIGGNSGQPRGAGYWQTQYRPRPTAFSEAQRLCYLEIVGFMSQVFHELRDASTVAQAFDVLAVNNNSGSALQHLDRELLAAWLNFANGGFLYGELVDSDGDGVDDMPFANLIATAEAVRMNPASTAAQLHAQRDALERING